MRERTDLMRWRKVVQALLAATLMTPVFAADDSLTWEHVKRGKVPYIGVMVKMAKRAVPNQPMRPMVTDYFIVALITPSWLLLIDTKVPQVLPGSTFWILMGITEFTSDKRYSEETGQERLLKDRRIFPSEEDVGLVLIKVEPFIINKGFVETIPILDTAIWPKKNKETCRALAWFPETKTSYRLRWMQFQPGSARECHIPPMQSFSLCAKNIPHQKLCAVDPKPAYVLCQDAVTAIYAKWIKDDKDCAASRGDKRSAGRLMFTLENHNNWIFSVVCPDALLQSFFVLPMKTARAPPSVVAVTSPLLIALPVILVVASLT